MLPELGQPHWLRTVLSSALQGYIHRKLCFISLLTLDLRHRQQNWNHQSSTEASHQSFVRAILKDLKALNLDAWFRDPSKQPTPPIIDEAILTEWDIHSSVAASCTRMSVIHTKRFLVKQSIQRFVFVSKCQLKLYNFFLPRFCGSRCGGILKNGCTIENFNEPDNLLLIF